MCNCWTGVRAPVTASGFRHYSLFDCNTTHLALEATTSGRVLMRKANASWTSSGCSPYSTPMTQRTLVQSKMAHTISTMMLFASWIRMGPSVRCSYICNGRARHSRTSTSEGKASLEVLDSLKTISVISYLRCEKSVFGYFDHRFCVVLRPDSSTSLSLSSRSRSSKKSSTWVRRK